MRGTNSMSYLFSNGLKRRSMLKTMAAGAGLAGAGTLVNIVPGFAQDTFKVSMQLGWLAGNGNLGEIAADKLGESFFHTYEMPVITVRPFNTYGPRQSARAVIPSLITQMLAGGRVKLGATTPTRDFNFVKDTANGFIKAAETEAAIGETLNLATGKEISIGDLAKKIAGLIDKEVEFETEERRIRPGTSEVMRLCGSGEKAAALIGWTPEFTLDEGLRQTIDWLRDTGSVDDPGRYRV